MKTIGLVGPGRVGRTFAALLPPDQFELGPVLASSWVSSKRAARELRRGRPARGFEDFSECDWILVCTSEQAFPGVCEGLAACGRKLAGKVLLHTLGLESESWAAGLREARVAIGRVYPFDLFTRPSRSLAEVPFLIGGDPRALRAARALVRAFGAEALRSDEAESDHAVAAAALLPDALFDLFDIVVDDMASAGVPRKKAVGALSHLVDSTVRDYSRSSRQVKRQPPPRISARAATQWLNGLQQNSPSGRLIDSIVRWALEVYGYDSKKLGRRDDFSGGVHRQRRHEEAEVYSPEKVS